MRFRIYETCVAQFSTVVEADTAEDAADKFNKSNPPLTLESIEERVQGSKLRVKRLKDKTRKKVFSKKKTEILVEEK